MSQLAGTELNTHSLEIHQLLAIQLYSMFANMYPVFYLKQRITMAYCNSTGLLLSCEYGGDVDNKVQEVT